MPNSTADKTRKKKVNDKKFILSYIIPTESDTTYKVIHSISAVSKRCNAVLTFITMVSSITKKNIENKLRSPIYIIAFRLLILA